MKLESNEALVQMYGAGDQEIQFRVPKATASMVSELLMERTKDIRLIHILYADGRVTEHKQAAQ